MKNLFFTFAFLWLLSFNAQSQISTIINTGVAGTPAYNAGPIYRSSASSGYDASRYCYLYTQSELAAAGIFPGTIITELGWVKNNTATTTGAGVFRIYMKSSAATTFSLATETWANLNSGTTLVYENLSQDVPATVTPDYIPFVLNAPFVYTGGSLEISTEWDITQVSGNPTTGTFDWLWSTVTDRIYGTGQTSLGNAGTLSSTSNSISAIDDRRPFIKITYLSGVALDGVLSQFTSPTTLCPGTGDVAVRFANYGTDTIISATINWSVNGAAQTPFAYNDTLLPLESVDLTLGSYSFLGGVSYDIQAYIVDVNGTTDGNNVNDTLLLQGVQTGLAGGYTIDSSLVTSGTNFQSFTDLVSALSSLGVCGPVVVNVVASSGPYVEQVIIPEISGASAINTVTINGNGEILEFNSTNTGERAALKLNGADHFTIDNLNIKANGTYGFGVHLTNGADSNTISNCVIDINLTSTSTNFAGIVISSSGSSATTTGASNCDYNDITGNTINGGYYGISLVANGSTDMIYGNQVTENIVNDFYQYGIYLNGNNGTVVDGNDISRPLRTTVTNFYGVFHTGVSYNMMVSNNRIHNPFDGNPASTSGAYGIYHTNTDATLGNENYVVNNVIYNFNGSGTQNGFLTGGSDYTKYYHNTISLDDNTTTCATCATRGYYLQTASAVGTELINNNFSITRTNGGESQGIYFAVAGSAYVSDYNNIYVASSGSLNQVGYFNGAGYTTLTDWVTATQQDSNSLSVNPLYTNPSIGNLAPTSPTLNNQGTPIGIDFDITGMPRDTATPDIGAFEFDVAGTDAGATAVTTQSCPGTDSVYVTVQNFGIVTLTSIDVYASVNGTPTPFNGNTFAVNIPSGGSTVLSMGAFTFAAGTAYTVTAFTSQPNGILDTNNPNDTITSMINLALTGNYTINSALSTGGTNFQSFNDAATALNTIGVCAPVVIDVVTGSGPYTEQVMFNEIPGASAINTVTINGNGETLAFAPPSTAKYIVRLNGTDYMTIDSLKIVGTDPTYGIGILLSTNAEFNVIRECEIDLSAITSTSTANSAGISVSASITTPISGGNNANYNQILNNTIKGGTLGGPYYGITMYGTTGSVGCVGNTISGNILTDFYHTGIRLNLTSDCNVLGNDLSRPTLATAAVLEGIYLTGTANPKARVFSNRIHNTHDANPSNTSTFYGVDVTTDGGGSSAEIVVANNAIYNVNHSGTAYPIYISGSDFSSYYHNSISLDNTGATGTTNSRGIYLLGTSNDINIKNNVISITRGGTGAMYGLYYNTLPTNLVSDYNNVYVNTTSASNFFGYNGTAQPTLADWIATSFRDSSSFDVNPLYSSPLTGNLTPAAATLNNAGQDLTAIVPTDILGNLRTSPPDPGAFEFTPSLDDAGALSITSPFCPGTDTVFVTVQNFGAATLTSVQVYAEANGVPTPASGNVFAVNLLPGETALLNLGALTYTSGNIYNLTAYTIQPNGANDSNNSNDSATLTVNLGLVGNYTINSALATGGSNFQSFTDAAADLNSYGVCGPVVITVTPGSGPYTNQQIILGQIVGVSAINTVTFNGSNEVFAFTSTNTNTRAGIKLDGTDHVVIENLTIVADGTYGWGVHLSNNADYNTIRNNTIYTDTTSTSTTNYSGIVMVNSNTSLTTTGSSGNNNLFEANVIRGGYHGISMVGQSTTIHNVNNRVIGNTITHYHSTGLNSDNQDTSVVEGNIVEQRIGGATTGYGLNLGYNGYVKASKNKILTRAATTNYGIYTNNGYSSPSVYSEISNNFITCLGGTGTIYGIYAFNNYYMNIYHNSVNVSGGSATAGRAIYLNSSSTGAYGFINVKNNIGVNTGPGYAIEISNNAVTLGYVTSMDNNDWYGTGAVLGRYNNINSADIAGWVTISAFDSNSVSMDPQFVSSTDLHASSPFLNDRGAVGLGINDDIDGDIRCPNVGCAGSTLRPDIGADEFLGAAITVDMGVDLLASPVQTSCYTASETVTVQIKNFNTQSINFNLYPVTVYASVSGPNPVTFTPFVIDTGTLDADSVLLVTFDVNYDMSVPGTYSFTFFTSENSDANNANDTVRNANLLFTVGTIANTFAEVCSGSPFELKMDGITGPVQWQSYDDINSLWVNETAPGFDSTSYFVIPTATTLYRALVCGTYESATDTLVPVTVTPPTVINDTICGPGVAHPSASGTGDVTWFAGATGGNPLFSGDTFSVAVSTDTTFYVETSQALTGGGGSLKITEIFVDDPDAIEIQNLSSTPINTTGWVVAISNNYSNINTVNSILWNLPATINPGQILTRSDASGSPDYWGNNMLWNPANGSTRGWAMIVDNLGNVVDFVVWDNWPAGAVQNTFNPTVSGFSITIGNQWVGDTASTTGIGTMSLARVGNSDNNDRNDFVFQTSSIGSQNPGLSTVFQGGGCSSVRVPVQVAVLPAPVVNLGPDTTQCEGTITLDAGNPGDSYVWNTAEATQSIIVDTSGTYAVTVTSANGCSDDDAININIAPYPVANLGADTAICGASVVLTTSNLGNSFIWSTGSTAPFITVTTSGDYSVTVTSPDGCASNDSVSLVLNPVPVVTLIGDTAQCGGTIELDAANAGSSYLWSNGELTQTISVSQSGNYEVVITDANNCTASDDVDIMIYDIPAINLSDTTQCGGSVTLDAANAGSSYLWSNNATSQYIVVSTTDTYSVTVTSNDGCTATEDASVTINATPTVTFALAADTVCLDGNAITLSATPAGGTFTGSGVSGSTFTPSAAGAGVQTITYSYTDNNGCSASASDDIEVVICVGITEAGEDILLTLYPNPSEGIVFVSMSVIPTNSVRVEVFAVDGKLVREVVNVTHGTMINLSDVASGVYTFRVSSGGECVIKRIVIE